MHTDPKGDGQEMVKIHGVEAHPSPRRDSENPGYEVQDVNVGGIVTFVAGLAGFVLIFFVFCFFMGKAINYVLSKQDGPLDKWHAAPLTGGEAAPANAKRENLASNAEMEQKQLALVADRFPHPRLETDDGNQDVTDLHAREDLLLDYYSTAKDLPAGTVRIPIARAMQLIVQRGLPQPPAAAQQGPLMAGETAINVQAPLTDGFARTGYELDQIEARHQRLEFSKEEK